MGKSEDKHFQNFHRVLNRAQWSALTAGRLLLRLLVSTFASTGELVFGLDDTIERRRGGKIKAKGIYRDPVRSSKSHFVKTSGLRWLSCMLLHSVPWAGTVWGLPFLTVLCSSERYYAEKGREHQKLTERAWQMIALVARWLPDRVLVFVTDSSFAVFVLLDQVSRLENVSLITRLRMDAQLYDFAPERKPGQKGRPRLKGARRPSPQQRLADPETKWKKIKVENWDGAGARQVQVYSETCLWGTTGKRYVPIRWVLVRDVLGEFEPCAFLSTELTHQPLQILTWFVRRWRMEVTFEEARAHLGIETRAAMERPGHCALDANSVWLVFVGDVAGQHLDQRQNEGRSHGGLVCQRATDLQRHAGVGKTVFCGAVAIFKRHYQKLTW